ncbi:MAG TPA: undecaprenyl-diphosphatase UppP [Patescibacteria group bacterium]|nr:undecaprenyl-diphosphatase UppP [Patescibacteria group bacterium]
MNVIHAVILGIVEGITEFLPISSTGHLILVSNILQIAQTDFVKTFEIAIQSGAILAVIALYWRRIMQNVQLFRHVVVAFIPTGIVGFVLYKLIKHYLLGNSMVVVVSLLVGGVALIGIEMLLAKKAKKKSILEDGSTTSHTPHATSPMSYEKAAIIGLFQSIAVIPGVSRSASTIVGAMLLGVDRTTATEFSFLLAVPTMLAATALDLKDSSFSFGTNEWIALGVGFIVAFAVAIVAIKWLVKYVQTHNFIAFGIYRIIIAIIFSLILK